YLVRGDHVHLGKALVHNLEDHGQVLVGGGQAKHGRPFTTPASHRRSVAGLDRFFSLLDRDSMLGDVLDVSLRVCFQIPDALDVRHRLVLRISPRTTNGSTFLPAVPQRPEHSRSHWL